MEYALQLVMQLPSLETYALSAISFRAVKDRMFLSGKLPDQVRYILFEMKPRKCPTIKEIIIWL